jgi:hypothetical protein
MPLPFLPLDSAIICSIQFANGDKGASATTVNLSRPPKADSPNDSSQRHAWVTRGRVVFAALITHPIGMVEKMIQIHAEQGGRDKTEIGQCAE